MTRAAGFLDWMATTVGGALLMLVYLKRVEGMQQLQDLQDGMFGLLMFILAARYFVDRKVKAMVNG